MNLVAQVLVLALSQSEAPLPPGVRAVWDSAKAFHETTPTRERVSLNGLWRWQPGGPARDAVPEDRWGFFKVPGFWPGRNDYQQEDCQTLHVHPAWKGEDLGRLSAAWYQREFTVPDGWAGRRIALEAEAVNSFATVYVDGKKAGEIRFPAGEVDLTAVCRPGARHVLSVRVIAMPLRAVMLSYGDMNAAQEVKGSVARRGLCGDVTLVGTPAGPRIKDVKVDTSVRKGEITAEAGLEGLAADALYALQAEIRENGQGVREWTGPPFRASDLKDGRIAVTEKWKPERLWDVHTPQNLEELRVSLVSAGRVLDTAFPVRFGYREFWIDGRDFILNGTRLFLSALPIDNAQVGARVSTYEGAKECLRRLQSFGINFVYTHNYGCEPGTHVDFTEILRAADDVGMLVSFSQPHYGQYDWKAADADRQNGYARHAEYYVRVAQNHPSVVAYSMNHNATGYEEDMNPEMIDGLKDPRESWGKNGAKLALRAEAIVRRFDPGRIVYHHSSGNLGSMHTANFYTNFVPVQELSDWFEHWATQGVKPMFTVEYGVPFSWDWTQYRGWYKGERTWGSASVPWEFCLAEWNAQFLGDRAFKLSELEKRNIRWEAGKFRAGLLWHRWDYPGPPGTAVFDDQQAVYAMYFTDVWRAYRTWGLSANSPWECGSFWKLREGADRTRREFKVDWESLQRPGFSPDFYQRREMQMYLDLEWSDWVALPAAQALIRNNRPLLAYLAGKPARFTSKDHVFLPGETVEKQLILINNSREPVSCEAEWSLGLPEPQRGAKKVVVKPGDQERLALRFELPQALAAGPVELAATVRFGAGEVQKDSFSLSVLAPPAAASAGARIALFDPKGETGKLLAGLGQKAERVEAAADLSSYEVLLVGKDALAPDGPGPDLGRVRDGLKVVVFEQSGAALEQRLGFRVAEYGLRHVFRRVPDHPVLAGLEEPHLRDWHGEATILPPRLTYEMRPRYGPTVKWCGLDVTRAWRCGCRGNVASVLIEKPARGDFLPIVDGGYGLQYSPLLEYREGKGLVLFCQMDVTGRTEPDPAADRLVRNLLRYVSSWKPAPERKACYLGDPAGRAHLESAGFALAPYGSGTPAAEGVLILGPGAGREQETLGSWLTAGGRVLAIGLGGADALPVRVPMKKQEHLSAFFDRPGAASPFAGVGPADVHNRDPREISLVDGGVGDGVLAESGGIVLCQLAPWTFDAAKSMNLKRTFRRTSYLVTRLASNLGVQSRTPLLARFAGAPAQGERRWLEGLYLDTPEEWDDPYRFFRW
jgi:beta-galactosidase